jgi:Alginate lyase
LKKNETKLNLIRIKRKTINLNLAIMYSKTIKTSFLTALSIVFVMHVSFAQVFQHPGAMNTKKDLDFIKGKIKLNQEPWKTAYANFLTEKEVTYQGITPKPFSSLDYVAHPFTSVNCGSFNQPNEGCNDIVYDGMAAYSLALRYYITDDVAYAKKAISILMLWADKYQKNTESNSDLVVSWATPWYVNAAEILRYTPNSSWSSTNTTKMNNMLNLFKAYVWSSGMESRRNNWVMSAVEARIAIAIFQDNRTDFNKAIQNWKDRAKTYIYLTKDGAVPLSAVGDSKAQVTSTWKQGTNSIQFVDGVTMETCRDINHMKLGVKSLINAAELAWSQGVDLFGIEKDRFAKMLELHSPWMMGVKPPAAMCDGTLNLVSQEAFEIAYNHLSDRLKVNLPNTKKMLLLNRPNSASRWVGKWETLCYADRPFITSPGVPTALEENNVNSSSENALSVYPNPSNTGEFSLSKAEEYKVFTTEGKLIMEGNSDKVNLQTQREGYYILKVGQNVYSLIYQK